MHYHARDMAVVRGHIARIPIVLSSATPSLETVVNMRGAAVIAACCCPSASAARAVAGGRSHRPAPGAAAARPLHLAGAGRSGEDRGSSRREQALLFLNRRGYAPLTLCRACGFRFSCHPNCDAWLVDHRFRKQLVCHHCRLRHAASGQLPEMPGAEFFRRLRPGRRAPRRRSARIVSGGPRAGAVQRSCRDGRASCARN